MVHSPTVAEKRQTLTLKAASHHFQLPQVREKWGVFSCILHTGSLRLQPAFWSRRSYQTYRGNKKNTDVPPAILSTLSMAGWTSLSSWLCILPPNNGPISEKNTGSDKQREKRSKHLSLPCVLHHTAFTRPSFKERAALSTAAGEKKNRMDTRGILYKCQHCSYLDLVMSQICCCEHKSKTVNSDNKHDIRLRARTLCPAYSLSEGLLTV